VSSSETTMTTLQELVGLLLRFEADGAAGRLTTPVALHITVGDDGLIDWFRLYEDSHAVATAFS